MKRSTILNVILFVSTQFTVATVLGQSCRALDNEPWSYTGRSNGPDQWAKTYKKCGGQMQSPINIDTDEVESDDDDLEPLELVGYDKAITKATIENNGHTVMVVPRDRNSRYIEIEEKRYNLRQFHFHWSQDTNNGSEHAFDSTRYTMEAHFVHMNQDDEIAVVGVIYEIGDTNKAFKSIVGVLNKIRYKNQRTTYKGQMNLSGFFPGNPASFYRYQGSLTTPPCSEGVTWTVVKKKLQVGEEQLGEFLNLYAVPKREAEPGCKITTNVRPLQKINNREVYESA